MPFPKGMLLGSNPFIISTHRKPGKVGHNSDRCITHEAESLPPSKFSLSTQLSAPHTPAAYSDVTANTTGIPSTIGVHVLSFLTVFHKCNSFEPWS